MSKLSSLTIFFPFYNDEGTVEEAIRQAYLYGRQVSRELEVIAIHGGNSKDHTWQKLQEVKKKYPSLKLIDKKHNRQGYAVIKHGFLRASKDWVFYTDGDLQYDLAEIVKLVKTHFETKATVVNGFKIHRGDHVLRLWGGQAYAWLAQKLFHSPIRDIDCDFRLIDRSLLKKIAFETHNASILPELITKLKASGGIFCEIPVSHRVRSYGHSNYTFFSLLREKVTGDIRLWRKLRQVK